MSLNYITAVREKHEIIISNSPKFNPIVKQVILNYLQFTIFIKKSGMYRLCFLTLLILTNCKQKPKTTLHEYNLTNTLINKKSL